MGVGEGVGEGAGAATRAQRAFETEQGRAAATGMQESRHWGGWQRGGACVAAGAETTTLFVHSARGRPSRMVAHLGGRCGVARTPRLACSTGSDVFARVCVDVCALLYEVRGVVRGKCVPACELRGGADERASAARCRMCVWGVDLSARAHKTFSTFIVTDGSMSPSEN